MNAAWQAVGVVLTYSTIAALALLALTEFLGARVPGFLTISEATRQQTAHGDYTLFILVLALFLLAAGWWSLHVLAHL